MAMPKTKINQEANQVFTSFQTKDSLFIKKLICRLFRNSRYYRYQLIKSFRYFNYYQSLSGHILKKLYWGRKYGKYSLLTNCQIDCDNIGEGLYIEHTPIVINKASIIGNNLRLIGNNCIGGGGRGAPTIGNNVTLGYGAIIIGDVTIADNVIIGAGAIVTKSIEEEGAIVVGINQILLKK